MFNIDYTKIIEEAINSLFNNLFSSIDNNIYPILDKLVFIDESIIGSDFFKNVLGTWNSGLLLVTNSLILGFLLYYCAKLFFSYYFGTEIESPFQIIIKLIITIILINYSFFICSQIISLINSINLSISEIGKLLFNKEICFSTLMNEIDNTLFLNDNFNIFSLDGILKSVVSIGIFSSILSYSLRYIMIEVLVLLCPFSLLTLINSSTYWIFKSWLKSFLSLLFLQILVSIILMVPFTINLNLNFSNIFNKLVFIGSIYALTKANDFLRETIGGISTNIQTGFYNLKNTIK